MSLNKLLEVERRMKISNFRLIMCTICVCIFLTLQTCPDECWYMFVVIQIHTSHMS